MDPGVGKTLADETLAESDLVEDAGAEVDEDDNVEDDITEDDSAVMMKAPHAPFFTSAPTPFFK